MTRDDAQPKPQRRLFYGRRQGRPLRPGRARLMEELLPSLRVSLPEGGGPLDLAAVFDDPDRPVWLEIGFGAGEHLAAQAAEHPQAGFLGAEVFVNGIASLLAQVEAQGLTNVRIFQDDARDLLEALPEASIARAAVLFPDPWPKARHKFRRIIQRGTLDRLAFALEDGAELRLATDDEDYLAWMLELATAHPAFTWLARRAGDWRQRPADWPETRYEQKAAAKGIASTYLRFRRRNRR